MKKFKFQLETLLRVTRRRKEDAEIKFAEASRILEERREQLRVYLVEMQERQKEYEELTQEGKKITVYVIMLYNDFFNFKREQIEKQQGLILEARNEKQKKLDILMQFISKLKRIEQLKEKRYRQYQEEVLREEQQMLDEIGLQLYVRGEKREEELS